ncbi:MAG: hypothetical protein ACR2J9_05020 [Gaiellales bacterium]
MSTAHRRHDPAPTVSTLADGASGQDGAGLPLSAAGSQLTEAERQRRRDKLADDIRHGRLNVPVMSGEEFDALRRKMWIREL